MPFFGIFFVHMVFSNEKLRVIKMITFSQCFYIAARFSFLFSITFIICAIAFSFV